MLSKGIILLIVSTVPVISTPILQSVVGSLYGIASGTAKKVKSIAYDERTRTESSERSELLDELWWSDKEHSKEEREKVYKELYRSFLKDSNENAKKIKYLQQKRSNYNFEWKPFPELLKDLMGLEYFYQFAVALAVKAITSFGVSLMDKTIKQENWEPLSEVENACELVFKHDFFKNNDWILDKGNKKNSEKSLPETIILSNEKNEKFTRQAKICYGWSVEYFIDVEDNEGDDEDTLVREKKKNLEIHLISYKLHWFSKKASVFVLKRLDRDEYQLIGEIKAGLRKIGGEVIKSEEKRPSLFITRITVKLGTNDVFDRWHFMDFVVKFITYLLPDMKQPAKN